MHWTDQKQAEREEWRWFLLEQELRKSAVRRSGRFRLFRVVKKITFWLLLGLACGSVILAVVEAIKC